MVLNKEDLKWRGGVGGGGGGVRGGVGEDGERGWVGVEDGEVMGVSLAYFSL